MTTIPTEQLERASVLLGFVRDAIETIDRIPASDRGAPLSVEMRDTVATLLDFEESYIPGVYLAELPECDVPAMVDRLVTDCPEIDIPDHMAGRVDIVWKRSAGKSAGKTVLASCKPVGKRERQTWAGDGLCPWWRLTIALDVWILLDERQRWRLIHHELMHATYKGDVGDPSAPAARAHDIEEHAATVARYGLGDVTAEQASFAAQVMARPKIVEELRTFDVDPATGQGLLFGATLTPVGW